MKPAEIKPTQPAGKAPEWQTAAVCVFLALAVWAVFGQTARFGFVNYDDNAYVYENPKLAGGLSFEGVAWAFSHAECFLYHPLTMISLRLDYQLHGLHAGGYHLTNVLIHTASVVLLFLILRRMTGALWRSAFVAAVFAIHPLRVESVAWVTERKDVLGTFFFMLTVAAYVRYAEERTIHHSLSAIHYSLVLFFFVLALLSKPMAVTLPFVLLHATVAMLLFLVLRRMTGFLWRSAFVAAVFAIHPLRVESVAWVSERKDMLHGVFFMLTLGAYVRYVRHSWSLARYWAVVILFALGLMSKPTLMTLPFVLLLLDVWPLRRANRMAILWEKIPLFALAAGESLVTFLAQEHGRAVRSLSTLPFGLRLENALISYLVYIARMFWPAHLAVFYPYSHDLPAWGVAGAAVALAGISILVVRRLRTDPYLAVGWFW